MENVWNANDENEMSESEKELLNLIISQIINQILPCLQ